MISQKTFIFAYSMKGILNFLITINSQFEKINFQIENIFYNLAV
jgi:hypothetical protein